MHRLTVTHAHHNNRSLRLLSVPCNPSQKLAHSSLPALEALFELDAVVPGCDALPPSPQQSHLQVKGSERKQRKAETVNIYEYGSSFLFVFSYYSAGCLAMATTYLLSV